MVSLCAIYVRSSRDRAHCLACSVTSALLKTWFWDLGFDVRTHSLRLLSKSRAWKVILSEERWNTG